jgi:hypothetical protein
LVKPAAVLASRWPHGSSGEPLRELVLMPPEHVVIKSFALSPDGSTVAIAGEQNGQESLWIRRFDSAESAVSTEPTASRFHFGRQTRTR